MKNNGRYHGGLDVITLNGFREVVNKVTSNSVRSMPWNKAGSYNYEPDPRRDIDDECGLPKTGQLTPEVYQMLFDREAVATRVVEVIPKECWRGHYTVYEDENVDTKTPFEEAWDSLGADLSGSGWYHDERGSSVWEYLSRADILSGIGRYGVILLGLDDNKDLSEPAEGIDEDGKSAGGEKKRRLMFMRVFSEHLAKVSTWVQDTNSPRHGQPQTYQITLNDPNSYGNQATSQGTTHNVHWSRIVHIADTWTNACSSEVLAVPRMQPVYNNIYGLRKIYNSSPEGFWRWVFPWLSFETHPSLGGDVDINVEELRDMFEEVQNSMQRAIVTSGMTTKAIAGNVQDPINQVKIQLEAICIKLSIPIRIFMGSERGELSSTQDQKAWDQRMYERFIGYNIPKIICPFVNRLISLQVLPVPSKYKVYIKEPGTMTPLEQAEIAFKRVNTLSSYQRGNVSSIMPHKDLLVREMGYEEEEAESILQGVTEDEQNQTAKVGTGLQAGGSEDVQPIS